MKKYYFICYRKGTNISESDYSELKNISLYNWELHNEINKRTNAKVEINSSYLTAAEFSELKDEYSLNNKILFTRRQFLEQWGYYYEN